MSTDQFKKWKRLQAFVVKHCRSFKWLGVYAFDLDSDITRCMREILHVRVTPNPRWDGKRAETAFLVLDINVIPLTRLVGDKQAEEMRMELRVLHDEQRKLDRESGFLIVISDVSSGMTNSCGMGFLKDTWKDPEMKRMWKLRLILMINAGVVG